MAWSAGVADKVWAEVLVLIGLSQAVVMSAAKISSESMDKRVFIGLVLSVFDPSILHLPSQFCD